MNAVLLRPLNGGRHAASSLASIQETARVLMRFRPFSYPEFVDIRSRNDVFVDLFAENKTRAGVIENGLTRLAIASYVSANFFRALGATPAIGRFFTARRSGPAAARQRPW